MTDFASPRAVIADALQAFLPPDRVGVADWAAEHRWLANTGGGHVGLWDNRIAPYLVEPMQALTSPAHNTVALVGPGQCGKTEVANNWMLASIDADPASFLRFMQTDEAIRAYVKDVINPMIEAHERIRLKQGLRPVDDSLGFKRFRGMRVQFLAAARNNLISKSAPRIVADEIDAYDPSLGDVKNLLDVRRQTFGRDSMLCMISHPDRAGGLDRGQWQAGIMAVYADSTRCTWWWPCPHCGAWSSPNPGTPRHMALTYPDDAPLDRVGTDARLLCPSNGCLVEDGERRAMLRRGRWIGRGQSIAEDGTVTGDRESLDIAGFWIVGAMSPFLLDGIGGLARARVKAERAIEAGEDDKSLREVMTKQWGIPYTPPRRVSRLEAAVLADRAEPDLQLGAVPEGVRFITAAADVQASRFEALVRGWGVGGESWVLTHWSMPADTAVSPGDWDAMIARLLAPLPLADGSGRLMRVHAAGFDSGGAEGVTLQAYGAWTRAKRAGLARARGKVDGRDAWSLLPLKGLSTPNPPRLSVVYPDSARKDRMAAARGQIPLGQFNPNAFKDDLAIQLARADGGPWAVHVPAGLRGDHLAPAAEQRSQRGNRLDAPPHRFFEQLVAETRSPKGAWTKTAAGGRNEALDLMVMTHVLAHLHGLSKLRWDAPRAWHAPWDANSGVMAPDAAPKPLTTAPNPGRVIETAPVPPGPVQLSPISAPPPLPAAAVVSVNTGPRSRASRMA